MNTYYKISQVLNCEHTVKFQETNGETAKTYVYREKRLNL